MRFILVWTRMRDIATKQFWHVASDAVELRHLAWCVVWFGKMPDTWLIQWALILFEQDYFLGIKKFSSTWHIVFDLICGMTWYRTQLADVAWCGTRPSLLTWHGGSGTWPCWRGRLVRMRFLFFEFIFSFSTSFFSCLLFLFSSIFHLFWLLHFVPAILCMTICGVTFYCHGSIHILHYQPNFTLN